MNIQNCIEDTFTQILYKFRILIAKIECNFWVPIEKDHKYHRTLFITFCCLLSLQISAAQIIVSGKIVDNNNESLAFVHLRIENTNIGTISNNSGLFKLTYEREVENFSIVISAVGYQTKKVVFREGHHIISLKQDITQLTGVTVVRKDYGKELVNNAIKAIPNNYPKETERHKGFVRERAFWKENKNPIYIAEAVIEAIKKPYDRKHRIGDVKLVEFRKYENEQIDSLKTRIYAGGHHIHRFDAVARREGFFKNLDAFKYEIKDTLRYQNKDIYKIHFEGKKVSGHVYVMDSSFAITKVDFNYRSFFELSASKRQLLNYSVTYEQGIDKIWRFKHSHYETSFKKKEKLLNVVSDYVTTETQINKIEIPYSNRLQFGDILTDELKEYKSDFWNSYNIIIPSKGLEGLFNSNGNSNKNNDKKKSNTLLSILQHVKLEITLKWITIDIHPHTLTYSNTVLDFALNGFAEKKSFLGLYNSFLFEIKPNLFIGYSNESKISKSGITSHDLVISKDFVINPNGRPILISPRVNLGCQVSDYFINSYTSTGDFDIKEKSFNSGRTDIFLSQRNFRLQPNIILSIEKSRRISYLFSVGYNFSLSERRGLLFQENNESIFSRKKVFLPNSDENLIINQSNNLLKNGINIGAGISYKF